jgi:hypothetical protein
MTIEVVKKNDEYTKEVWRFNMFDLNAVFIYWHKEIKPKGKRKWAIESHWNRQDRYGFKMIQEPVLPETIKSEVIQKIIEHIKVNTWDEWKTR